MTKKVRITIGIPAYNEEANIGFLLSDLSQQLTGHFTIDAIHIISDASTDATEKIARSYTKLPIVLSRNRKRSGIGPSLNKILAQAEGDILIILNADIRIKDRLFVQKIVSPIVAQKADLTSCNLVNLPPRSLVEHAIATSMAIKTRVFEEYRHGDNIYTCHGTARALSKKLYTAMRFPHSVGEDAYSYLYASYNHYPYRYVTNTKVYYRLPATFADHKKQSVRFFQSKQLFVEKFGELYMRKTYYIPQALLIQETIKYLIRYPINVMVYVAVYVAIRCYALLAKQVGHTWDIVLSSKHKKAL